MTATSRTPASLLQEYCVQRKTIPVYEIEDDMAPTHLKKFICKVTCDESTAVGEGRSKKEAKHAAAKKMLEMIKAVNANEPQPSANPPTVPSPYEGKVNEDFVGPLADFCTEYGIKAPEYLHTRAEGPPHATVFTFRCTVGSFQTEAIESTKKQAKQLASMYMLNRLKTMVDTRTRLELPEISFIDPNQEPDYRRACTLLSNSNFSDFRKILAGNLTHPLSSDFVQFKSVFHQDSEVYEEIKSMIFNYNEEDALTTLTSVLNKAEFKYTLIPIESNSNACSIILSVDCSPNLNIWRLEILTPKPAINVAVKTLKYMKILCFSRERRPVEPGEDIDFETLINVRRKYLVNCITTYVFI